jgi:hypothetical protein
MTLAPSAPLPRMMVLVPGPVMIEEFGARRMVYGVCIAIFLFY